MSEDDKPETVEDYNTIMERNHQKNIRDTANKKAINEIKARPKPEVKKAEHNPFDKENYDHERDLDQMDMEELENLKEQGIVKVDTRSRWETLKKKSKKEHTKTGNLKLFVSKEIKLKGKITHKLQKGLQTIPLINETTIFKEKTEDIIDLAFFDGDTDKRKRQTITNSLHKDMWAHNFIAKNKEFTLLADKETSLLSGEHTIEGSLVPLNDSIEIGNSGKIPTQNNIILLHTATPRLQQFKNNEEFFEKIKALGLNNDTKLREFVFERDGTYFSTPPEFEDMIMSFMFSCKKNGYPLAFLGIGKAGCGKSELLDGLHSKSGESLPFDGATNTLKYLIPSWKKTSNPSVGFYIESNRFCFVDEFLRILIKINSDERADKLTQLNDMFEHKNRSRGSGNCALSGEQVTSKFFGVTNAPNGCKTMKGLLEVFKQAESTLSRLLIFYYPDYHSRYVEEQKDNETQREVKPTNQDDFLGILDYLYSVECDFEHSKLKAINDKLKSQIAKEKGDENLLLSLWNARYIHHLKCLLDGIIKKRCVLEQDEKFKAKAKDYADLLNMGIYILQSWGIADIDESNKAVQNYPNTMQV